MTLRRPAPHLFFLLFLLWRLSKGPTSLYSDVERATSRKSSLQHDEFHLPRDEELLLNRSSYIYRKGAWDGAPIVLEEYKLLLFTIPKVGCTALKQLCRRMMHLPDLDKEHYIHWPGKNGLRYLYHYPLHVANEFLTSSRYTRAIFVRDPKERVLSAFLDKGLGKNSSYLKNHCCARTRDCGVTLFEEFLQLARNCPDPHWMPQSMRMESDYWPFIDFVGHLETAAGDVQRLLQHVHAWDEYGETGWGRYGNSSMFATTHVKHATGADSLLSRYYTPRLEQEVEQFYRRDYDSPYLNLTVRKIEWKQKAETVS